MTPEKSLEEDRETELCSRCKREAELMRWNGEMLCQNCIEDMDL